MDRVLLMFLALLIGTTAYAQRWAPSTTPFLPDGTSPSLMGKREGNNTAGAQAVFSGASWLPMGPGLAERAIVATTMNGELYVLHIALNDSASVYWISKWNGAVWEKVTELVNCCHVYSMASYRGQLYVGGLISNVNGLFETYGIIRWNGQSWEAVGTNLGDLVEQDDGEFNPYVMKEYKGELYVGGVFSTGEGRSSAHSIVRWDGTRWASLGTGMYLSRPSNTPYVRGLSVYRGKLYVGGWFDQAGGLMSPNLAVWNGETWEAMPSTPDAQVHTLSIYRGELYVHGPSITKFGPVAVSHLARWNGRQWSGVGTHGAWQYIRGLVECDGMLYACGTGKRDTGIARWNGTQWEEISAFSDELEFLIEHDGSLIVGGHFKEQGSTMLNYIARMCNDNECGTLSGSVYADRNDDCVYGTTDSALSSCTVLIEPGPLYVTVDANGRFAQKVLPGSYTLRLLPKLHWPQTCPQSPGTYSRRVTSGMVSADNNFASRPIPNVEDLRISISATRARPGRPAEYIITYENVGTVAASGSLTFTYDSRLTHAGSTPAPDATGTTSLTWHFKALAVDESRTIRTTLNVPTSVRAGDMLCGYVEIETQNTPDLLAYMDDRDSVCVEVTNSYDPNDITVRPHERDGNTGLGPADSVLAYTIRFQNTGNDTAFRIVVVDTLSSHLDPATLRLGAASHPCTFEMRGPGILTWTFNDIMLPDSGASEPNSHGVLKYFVRLRRNLPGGTTIPNRAAIYFDYNAPVATNTVVSVVAVTMGVNGTESGTSPLGMPNPSTGMVRIDAELREGGMIVVLDLLGNVVLQQRADGAPRTTLDLTSLPMGIYVISMPVGSGSVTEKLTIAR